MFVDPGLEVAGRVGAGGAGGNKELGLPLSEATPSVVLPAAHVRPRWRSAKFLHEPLSDSLEKGAAACLLQSVCCSLFALEYGSTG